MRQVFLLTFLIAASLPAQIVTGSMTGSVLDPSRAAVAEATVSVQHLTTGLERQARTDANGQFVLAGLEPGEYLLIVSKEGFKRVEQTNVRLTTGERLNAGVITLELGSVNQTVNVESEALSVKTQSAERSELITGSQVDGLLNMGRNVQSLVQLLPGVVVSLESNILDRRTDFSVLGNRRTANNVTVDGVVSTDVDNGFALKLGVSQDAIAEVQILLSNYQAEHGRTSGANVQLVTKSGSREFHGLLSYFKRHEQFNANNFFNNRLGVAKPRYRYHTYTYNIGGPVTIPRVFNRNRDKLFFFWSQEFWPNREGSARMSTMPTELERAGDFSQSLDVNDRLITIRDPFNNRTPFPANRIPANRLDPNGTALLKVFDTPNFFDRTLSRGAFNYVFTAENNLPKRTDSLKVDFNANAANLFYITYTAFDEIKEGPIGVPAVGQSTWPQMPVRFGAYTKGLATRYTRIVSPSVVNEAYFGLFTNPEDHRYDEAALARMQRRSAGFTAGQFNPAQNTLDLIPNATFGGVPGAATLNIDGRFPINDPNNMISFNDKISWIRGAHSFKAGVYVESFWRDITPGGAYTGNINFGVNANNPLDTGYAYSNAALGVFNSYTEASALVRQRARGKRVEFFAQDNSRTSRWLTLDYGLRLSWLPPVAQADDLTAGFVDSRFDPANAVQLIQPGLNAQRVRVGVHPRTGETYPATLIGAIAPGVGDSANGMVVAANDPNYPRALVRSRGIHLAPRIGFAIDPGGNGRTAIRGGFGFFYNPLSVSRYRDYVAQPPLVQTPVVNFGELRTLTSAASLLFPSAVTGIDPNAKVPSTMNYSLTIQRNIGAGTVVDIGYVGSVGRNLSWRRNLNPIPFGANFLPANQDPTLANRPLPPAFLRPFQGYNNILVTETASSSNYHSLQATANRRFARGVQFGASWTWSKAMSYNDEDGEVVSALVPVRIWNYGLSSFDRTHILKVNWLWDIPALRPGNPVARMVTDGWQVSGIASFVSGQPLGIGLSTTRPIDITGSPTESARVVVVDNPVLPKSERTFSRNFRTDVFRLPGTGTYGNAARTLIRGPGINNWDVAIFKNFRLTERFRLQFRSEMYNAFNHTQFTTLDTTARFEPDGQQVNSRLGEFTGARDGRQIQLALRLYF